MVWAQWALFAMLALRFVSSLIVIGQKSRGARMAEINPAAEFLGAIFLGTAAYFAGAFSGLF
jgi:hypothetical protein